MKSPYRIIKKITLTLVMFFMLAVLSCSDEDPPAAELNASFTSSTSIEVGQTVAFTDQSTGDPETWKWTFEGGDPTTSNEPNPTITYAEEGTFDVTLTITNQTFENTTTKEDYITVIKKVTAGFSASSTTILENESIQFMDETTGDPTKWNWTFEGGTPSTSEEPNPVVTYRKAGVYSVTLAATNDSDSNTKIEERLIHVTCTGIYCEPVFSTYTKTTDITYGVDAEGHKMILYTPDEDSRIDRPVVALMGGGAFEGTNLDLLEPIAINLVQHGAVVALLEYRVIDTDDGTTELINAQQDCRAATRYLRKESENLGIESNHIFIGGNGSGAFAALFHAYVDESDLSSAELNIINGLGGLEGEAQGNAAYSSEVTGIISLAGGMYNTLDPITSNDVPIYAIHGTADTEVPYDRADTNPVTYGAKSITDKVKSTGLTSHLYTIEGGSHSAPRSNSNEYILELMYFIRDIVQ